MNEEELKAVLVANPKIDQKVVRDAEAEIQKLRAAGLAVPSSYKIDPALGGQPVARAGLRWQNLPGKR